VKERIGWIGIGRMGYEMAARLAKGGADVTVWNRTRAKAEPLAAYGAKIADKLVDLAECDIVFCMVSTWDDVKEVVVGPSGLLSGARKPRMVVECSSISLEGSAELRALLKVQDIELLAAPVSGKRQGHQGRPPVVCVFWAEVGLRCGPAVSVDDRAGRQLRRRRRARAHRQDLSQRLPRRGHAIARGDHGAGAKGRRAAARIS